MSVGNITVISYSPILIFYFPFHTGARFSANARGPSLLSSAPATGTEKSDSRRIPSLMGR
jgi:hypothetical protein